MDCAVSFVYCDELQSPSLSMVRFINDYLEKNCISCLKNAFEENIQNKAKGTDLLSLEFGVE